MSYTRRILAVLIGIGILVLLFVLIVRGFGGGNNQSPIKETKLVDFAATDAVAQLYIDGPVVLDQDHRAVKILVSRDQTEIDIIKGYEGTVIDQQVYPNNEAAYAVFLQALDHLNFDHGNTDPAQRDERGFCAQNDRYVYQLSNNGSTVFRYWSTSCGQGTFGGDRLAVRNLFRHQIPQKDFNDLTRGIPL
jgi:hypothetical protein